MSLLAVAILAPLAGAAALLTVRRAPGAFALAGAGASLFAGVRLLAAVADGARPAMSLPGLPGLPLRLTADPLTVLLSVLVAVIAGLVLVYAVGYMQGDPQRVRFFATMLLFVAAMQALVLAGDWILLLASWELIGFSSYLLIGFWHDRPGVAKAATRAFLVTRTADLGLYLAVFVLIAASGGSDVAASLGAAGPAALAAGALLLVAATGKSAQLPLHGWLPAAMAGPTPVSALLHSATLVAAGVIVLIRVEPSLPPAAHLAIGLVGGATTVVTGLVAVAEPDLKRLLAASTSSQYGLMLVAVGAGMPLAALLLLIAHAAIKSALFLGAGVFQHARGTTELAKLRGAGRDRPGVLAGFAVAALALAGIPPLSGFLPKDAVIAAALASPHAALFGSLALAGTLLTGAYVARAVRILWRGERQPGPVAGMAWMAAGFAGLVALAAGLGLAYPSVEHLLAGRLSETPVAQAAALGAALSGLALGWAFGPRDLLGPLLPLARRGFAFAGGVDAWVVRPTLAVARACDRLERALYRAVLALGAAGMAIARRVRITDDRGIDRLITGVAHGSQAFGARLRALQSGLVHRELLLAVVGSALLLGTLIVSLLASPIVPVP